jgi:adenylate cyclase/guanylate cyclase
VEAAIGAPRSILSTEASVCGRSRRRYGLSRSGIIDSYKNIHLLSLTTDQLNKKYDGIGMNKPYGVEHAAKEPALPTLRSADQERAFLVNATAFIAITFAIGGIGIVSIVLFISGHRVFSESTIIILSMVPLLILMLVLNRYSSKVAAAYFIVLGVLAFSGAVYAMGTDHGIVFGVIVMSAPIALLFGLEKPSVYLSGLAFLALFFSITLMISPRVGETTSERSEDLQTAVRIFAGIVFMGANFVSVAYSVRRADRAQAALEVEHARSEALLYNLLPEEIAARLKVEPDQTIADSLPKVAILFADIVDFTALTASLPPEQVLGFLNTIFSRFDDLAEKHQLEKVKTIGDAYMVAAGMPSPVGDPVHRIADMALDMRAAAQEMSASFPEGLEVRIGLHAGPVVAGVIGNKKLFYDVWGEAVNTASRMESHGEPGHIQVTGLAYEELRDDYTFDERGILEVKGMGKVETWWLIGKRMSA